MRTAGAQAFRGPSRNNRAIGALHPVLLFNRAIDDGCKEGAKAGGHDLRDAAEAVLAGGKVAEPVTMAMGCSIKWHTRPAGLHKVR